jgi:uncharacterized protein (DUF433 family)
VHSRPAHDSERRACQLAAGRTVDQVLKDYPYLERDDIFAALEYGAAAVRERELPLTKPA